MMRFQFRSSLFCHMCTRADVPLFAPAGLKFLISIIYQPEVRTSRASASTRIGRIQWKAQCAAWNAKSGYYKPHPFRVAPVRDAWCSRMHGVRHCLGPFFCDYGLVLVSKCERRVMEFALKTNGKLNFLQTTHTMYIVSKSWISLSLSLSECWPIREHLTGSVNITSIVRAPDKRMPEPFEPGRVWLQNSININFYSTSQRDETPTKRTWMQHAQLTHRRDTRDA